MNEILTFQYKEKATTNLMGALFFGACAIVLFFMAIGNDRGLILNGFIRMSETIATIFYYVLAVISSGATLLGVEGLYRSLTTTQSIKISQDSIVVPKSERKKTSIELKFSDIVNFDHKKINKLEFFNIHHTDGKISIDASMCRTKEEFSEIVRMTLVAFEGYRNRPT